MYCNIDVLLGVNKGKVITVYRRRWCIYIDKLQKTKANGKKLLFIISKTDYCIGAPY